MKDLTIFISSSDSYKDCWPPFFHFLRKGWPDCTLPIILNTETAAFEQGDTSPSTFANRQIHSTELGKQKLFGDAFTKGLGQVQTTNVLLIMIDYFIMEKVDVTKLTGYYQAFKEGNFDSICLVQNQYKSFLSTDIPGLNIVQPPERDMFSYQMAFWKKSSLQKLILRHESPWESEWHGTKRANKLQIKLGFVEESYRPIKYLLEGALHKGKWVPEMIEFLQKENYPIDFDRRGIYKSQSESLFTRIRKKLNGLPSEIVSRVHLASISNKINDRK